MVEFEPDRREGSAKAEHIADTLVILVDRIDVAVVPREDSGGIAASLEDVLEPATEYRAGNGQTDDVRVGG